jgi:hypothetical protein
MVPTDWARSARTPHCVSTALKGLILQAALQNADAVAQGRRRWRTDAGCRIRHASSLFIFCIPPATIGLGQMHPENLSWLFN